MLSHLLDNICTLRGALDEHEGNRRKRTLHELRTNLALALVMADKENRQLGGSAAVNVEHLDGRDEARILRCGSLSTDSGFKFPMADSSIGYILPQERLGNPSTLPNQNFKSLLRPS